MEHAPTIGALCGGRLAKAKGVRYGHAIKGGTQGGTLPLDIRIIPYLGTGLWGNGGFGLLTQQIGPRRAVLNVRRGLWSDCAETQHANTNLVQLSKA